ncbi:hypothetical protein GC197_16700 [bacterium]|nr:hypothetical protein [bacterium]
MWNQLALLADKDDINQYLENNPMLLGGIAILIGLGITAWGGYELMSGVAHDKYGNKLTGGTGKFVSFVRVAFGVAAIGFGFFKMIF